MMMGLTFLVVKRRGNMRSIHTFGELTIQSMDNDQLLRCFSISLAPHAPPAPPYFTAHQLLCQEERAETKSDKRVPPTTIPYKSTLASLLYVTARLWGPACPRAGSIGLKSEKQSIKCGGHILTALGKKLRRLLLLSHGA